MSERLTEFHSNWNLPRISLVGNPENWGCRAMLPWWRKAIGQHKAWKKAWTSSQMSWSWRILKITFKIMFLDTCEVILTETFCRISYNTTEKTFKKICSPSPVVKHRYKFTLHTISSPYEFSPRLEAPPIFSTLLITPKDASRTKGGSCRQLKFVSLKRGGGKIPSSCSLMPIFPNI